MITAAPMEFQINIWTLPASISPSELNNPAATKPQRPAYIGSVSHLVRLVYLRRETDKTNKKL